MAKQILLYIILSVLMVVFAKAVNWLMIYIDMIYALINVKLIPFFNTLGLGWMIRKIVLLIVIPILIVAIPAIIYRLIRGKIMPYFIESTWCVWVVLMLSDMLIN